VIDRDIPGPDAPGRLPWATVVLEGRRYFVGMVGLLLVPGSLRAGMLALFSVVFLVRVLQLRLLRWWVSDEALVIERGLAFRSRRVIPRARIQAVDLERGLLHRLMGITEVRVEALGGGATEGALPGVHPAVAEALRRTLTARRDPAARPPEGEAACAGAEGTASSAEPEAGAAEGAPLLPPRIRMQPGEVMLAGLTESRIGAGLAAMGIGVEAARQGLFSGWFGEPDDWIPWVEALPLVAVGVGAIVIALLFSLVFSFSITALGYWNFTLRIREGTLEVERGLLTEHRDSVPRGRVQAVVVEENAFRRLMGLASVKVVVAGRAGSRADAGMNVVLPVGTRAQAFQLAADVLAWPGGAYGETFALAPMPAAARRRRWMRAALATGPMVLVAHLLLAPRLADSREAGWRAAMYLDPGALLLAGGVAVGVGLLALALADDAWRGLGWWQRQGQLVVREGALKRRTTLLPLDRLQSVELTANPFQRRLGLATLALTVARPLLESDPRALDLDRGVAEELRRNVLEWRAPGGADRRR
jgi:putative membrane protein